MMMNNRTAREIIIDLIDRKEITGEEAYTLIYELVNKVSWGWTGSPNITWTTTTSTPTDISAYSNTSSDSSTYTIK